MSGVKLIAPEQRKFDRIEGIAGDIRIGRDVASDISTTFGAGIATFEKCSMEWTVLYDEYFYCLEGTLTIKTKEGTFVMRPGRLARAPIQSVGYDHGPRDLSAIAHKTPIVAITDTAASLDMSRLRRYRLARVRAQLKANDFAGCLLIDPVNIRYAAGKRWR